MGRRVALRLCNSHHRLGSSYPSLLNKPSQNLVVQIKLYFLSSFCGLTRSSRKFFLGDSHAVTVTQSSEGSAALDAQDNTFISTYRVSVSLDFLSSHSISSFRAFQWWLGILTGFSSVQFSSVAQSCLTLCDPMNHSTPSLPVHNQLPEFTQTYVH